MANMNRPFALSFSANDFTFSFEAQCQDCDFKIRSDIRMELEAASKHAFDNKHTVVLREFRVIESVLEWIEICE
jgi:hypothetical protein